MFADHKTGRTQGAKMAWWEPRFLGSILMRGAGRGGGRRGENMSSVVPPACTINSWHEHNVSPLWFPALRGKQWNSQGPATSLLKAALRLRLVTNTLWSDLTHLLRDPLCNLRNEALYVESRQGGRMEENPAAETCLKVKCLIKVSTEHGLLGDLSPLGQGDVFNPPLHNLFKPDTMF